MKSQSIVIATLGIWATMTGSGLSQQTDAETLSPIEGGFVESFQGDTRLSGASGVFGVEFDKIDTVFNSQAIYVHIPKSFDGLLCVQMNSIDGDYWAEIQYDLSGMGIGTRRLNFETGYAEELARYSAEDIAILATVRPACTERAEAVLLASLEAALPEEIVFYLSGGDYTMSVALPHLDGGEVIFSCDELQDSSIFRIYNVKCVLPINSMLDYGKAKIHRKLLGATQIPPPIHLPISLPE